MQYFTFDELASIAAKHAATINVKEFSWRLGIPEDRRNPIIEILYRLPDGKPWGQGFPL